MIGKYKDFCLQLLQPSCCNWKPILFLLFSENQYQENHPDRKVKSWHYRERVEGWWPRWAWCSARMRTAPAGRSGRSRGTTSHLSQLVQIASLTGANQSQLATKQAQFEQEYLRSYLGASPLTSSAKPGTSTTSQANSKETRGTPLSNFLSLFNEYIHK